MKRKNSKQYTETFRKEAVNLVLEQEYTAPQATKALDIPIKLLYSWRKRHEKESSSNCSAQLNQDTFLKEFCSY